jgi:hypothetical protein
VGGSAEGLGLGARSGVTPLAAAVIGRIDAMMLMACGRSCLRVHVAQINEDFNSLM